MEAPRTDLVTTPGRRRAVRWALGGLVLYAVVVAVVVALPVSYSSIIDHLGVWMRTSLGWTSFGTGWIEFVANIVIFVPLGFLLTLLFRRAWIGALVGMAGSACVELVQTLIPHRQASLRDVVANTIGAAIGAFLVWLIVLRRRHAVEKTAASGRDG
jgi:glycopeptide antibiotics resistance protein